MLNPNNIITEDEYNQRLLSKLESNRDSAAIANKEAQPSRKNLNWLNEARGTQKRLGCYRTEYNPAEEPVEEDQDDTEVVYDYINQLDDDVDLNEMFNQAVELLSNNNENETNDNHKEELN